MWAAPSGVLSYTEGKKWSRNAFRVEPFSCPQDGPHLGTVLVPLCKKWLHLNKVERFFQMAPQWRRFGSTFFSVDITVKEYKKPCKSNFLRVWYNRGLCTTHCILLSYHSSSSLHSQWLVLYLLRLLYYLHVLDPFMLFFRKWFYNLWSIYFQVSLSFTCSNRKDAWDLADVSSART